MDVGLSNRQVFRSLNAFWLVLKSCVKALLIHRPLKGFHLGNLSKGFHLQFGFRWSWIHLVGFLCL